MSIISYFIFNITNNHTKQTQQFSFQSNQITAHQYKTKKEKITCGNCQALGISNLEAEKICHNQQKKKKKKKKFESQFNTYILIP